MYYYIHSRLIMDQFPRMLGFAIFSRVASGLLPFQYFVIVNMMTSVDLLKDLVILSSRNINHQVSEIIARTLNLLELTKAARILPLCFMLPGCRY